jgi:hypothetical protein
VVKRPVKAKMKNTKLGEQSKVRRRLLFEGEKSILERLEESSVCSEASRFSCGRVGRVWPLAAVGALYIYTMAVHLLCPFIAAGV